MAEANKVRRVCFVGRPNVGKSSLFNRMIGRKKAIVLDQPGVTRDVSRFEVNWESHRIELADLAGLEFWERKRLDAKDKKMSDAETLKKLATEAAVEYLKTADLVLFVVDGREDLTPGDEVLARLVRGAGKPVVLVLAKIEGRVEENAQLEVSKLGWGEALPTSAEHNSGIEDLRNRILEELFHGAEGVDHEVDEDIHAEAALVIEQGRGISQNRPIRLGVYGRPNVGKSTLVNQLLGEQRMITSPIAGTTVDTVDTDFTRDGKYYRILDTAGIRRRSKTEKGVEVLSVVQALKSVNDVDVSFLMLDGYEGVTDQDEKVAGELVKAAKPVVIVVNKWDLCKVERDKYAERLREELSFLEFAPVLFISAKSGQGLESLWDLVDEILTQRFVTAPTGELNRFIELLEGANNASGLRLYYATQTAKNPPTITIQVNDIRKVHFAFERHVKNQLRERYGWMASPIKLVFKERKRSPSKRLRKDS
ncbi:MAG: ribosome biogenesis GTPase Der [Deltaproteobacteria bacterium]|nr:ribosome biogenesis GTPase Der [Deltaproteobacteria bacterium]